MPRNALDYLVMPWITLGLLSYAKEFANNRLLHIVLVSHNEGSVMPILNKTSAMNRSACLIEVTDVPYPEALAFLRNGGIPESTSTKLAQYFGGRFVYLNSCIELYKLMTEEMLEDTPVREITSLITERRIAAQWEAILTTPLADDVLSKVSKEGELVVRDMLDDASPDDQKLIKQCINQLILANVLRYNIKGNVMWHSQIEKSTFEKQY